MALTLLTFLYESVTVPVEPSPWMDGRLTNIRAFFSINLGLMSQQIKMAKSGMNKNAPNKLNNYISVVWDLF